MNDFIFLMYNGYELIESEENVVYQRRWFMYAYLYTEINGKCFLHFFVYILIAF